MSRIVILSTLYLNIPSANGICARNIVEALRELGHQVEIICYDKSTLVDEKNLESIYTIPEPKRETSHSIGQKIVRTLKIVFGSTRPIINTDLVNEYLKRLNEISKKETIDAIIAMYFPFESVEAMCIFCEKNLFVKSIVYELDSVSDGVYQSNSLAVYNRAYEYWLKKVYERVTTIIVMNSHKDYWFKRFGKHFKNKCIEADIPVLQEKHSSTKIKEYPIKMLYSGLIEKRYRSPSYLLDVLRKIVGRISIEISFYSKGDCEAEISEAAKEIRQIKQYGYVTPKELEIATSDADFLISLGNSSSRSVPSKLITYFGYGKPIIHFSSQKDDVCNEYLSRYPLALIIDQSNSVDDNAERILNFIQSTNDKSVDFSYLKQTFEKNIPSFSAHIINDVVE